MKQQALSNFDVTWLPVTGLLIFCVCFAVYTWWTLRPVNRPLYEQASNLPFEEDTHEQR